MRASVVVTFFYLAAGIAPSFAAPGLLASDLAKIKESASYALQHSASTASHSTSTNEESTTTLANEGTSSTNPNQSTASDSNQSTSNSANTNESNSANQASTEETTTNSNSGGTNTAETTTPTTSSSTSKWRIPQQMSEQAMLQLTSGLIASAMTGVITTTDSNLTHRDVLEHFEARIDHELVARARQYRREALTMLLADLD
ncbi:hypothetical protein BJV74DRAFT_872595 [Russula compacta]|nr:hypothetical protein BJV74DRAFT_872595 [Russula compacta]